MFSIMALLAERLERIPQKLLKNGLVRLSTPPIDKIDPDLELEVSLHSGHLPPGTVTELCAHGGAALATTLALHACRHAQQQSQQRYGQNVWCAFVDPSCSLYAPGVAALGIDMTRLLVVRPDEQSLSRVTLRLVEAQVFPVVVVDTMGVPGAQVDVSLARWVQVVRRLNRAVEGTQSKVLLLTDQQAKRPLPLPVAQRFELTRTCVQKLSLHVGKSSSAYMSLGGNMRACRLSAQQILGLPRLTSTH